MEKTGVLSMEIVDHVFSKFCQESFAKENILHLMEQCGLIAKYAFPIHDVKYFVPAQLRLPPGQCHLKPALTDPCPLYLQFPSGFVPHGLFTQLVSRCISWCSKIEFKEEPCLFDGVAKFTMLSKDFRHQLICVCMKSFIKFLLRPFKTPQGQGPPLTEIEEMAALVWRFLKQTMTSLLDEWPFLTSLEYNWCVACPECSDLGSTAFVIATAKWHVGSMIVCAFSKFCKTGKSISAERASRIKLKMFQDWKNGFQSKVRKNFL